MQFIFLVNLFWCEAFLPSLNELYIYSLAKTEDRKCVVMILLLNIKLNTFMDVLFYYALKQENGLFVFNCFSF